MTWLALTQCHIRSNGHWFGGSLKLTFCELEPIAVCRVLKSVLDALVPECEQRHLDKGHVLTMVEAMRGFEATRQAMR